MTCLLVSDAAPAAAGEKNWKSTPISFAPGGTSRCRVNMSSRSRRQATRSPPAVMTTPRSEEHTSELQSLRHLVCRLLLEKKTEQRTSALGVSPPASGGALNSTPLLL